MSGGIGRGDGAADRPAVPRGVGGFSVLSYNRFVRQQQLVEESWRQVDVELRRRADLVANLAALLAGPRRPRARGRRGGPEGAQAGARTRRWHRRREGGRIRRRDVGGAQPAGPGRSGGTSGSPADRASSRSAASYRRHRGPHRRGPSLYNANVRAYNTRLAPDAVGARPRSVRPSARRVTSRSWTPRCGRRSRSGSTCRRRPCPRLRHPRPSPPSGSPAPADGQS